MLPKSRRRSRLRGQSVYGRAPWLGRRLPAANPSARLEGSFALGRRCAGSAKAKARRLAERPEGASVLGVALIVGRFATHTSARGNGAER